MPVDVAAWRSSSSPSWSRIYALQWAKAILVPILLGVMFSYALTPAVDRMERWHVPRALGAGARAERDRASRIGWGAWALTDDASALIETLPQVAQKVRHGLEGQGRKPTASTIEKVQQAANEIEQAAQQAAADASAAASAPRRSLGRAAARAHARSARPPATARRAASHAGADRAADAARRHPGRRRGPAFNVRDYLWTGTLGLFAFLGQTLVVLFVTLFLLASGNTFRRKMVKLAGPRLSQKKITIQALDEVSEQIQRYLLVQSRPASSSASRPGSPSTPSASTSGRSGASSPASPTSFRISAR